VRNKAAPEGCIAEGYIATKLVTFCSRYLDNAPTFHNRPQRNPDGSKGRARELPEPVDNAPDSSLYCVQLRRVSQFADVSSVYIFNRIRIKLLITIIT
jgi:hypothetical protein